MKHHLLLLLLITLPLTAMSDNKLTGTVIGTDLYVDYNTFAASTSVNTREMAFDGDLNTFCATWERSYTWIGLDLGEPYVITRVGWSPRNDGLGPQRVVLGMFEGANNPDFMDAVPLYMIDYDGTIGKMDYADVDCSRGFRYVRYVSPSDARCNIAEIEFYGYAGVGDDSHLYQLTNLPTVSIHTLNNEIPYDKEHDIVSQITMIWDNGTKTLSAKGGTRERGNYSRTFDKKPYRIKFDSKQQVLDAPAKAKKWTLINNYGDKTLMRNLIAFEYSRRLNMPYTPYAQAVDLILNGEYKGCYQLCDQVQVNKSRVEITEMTAEDNAGEALTGGYFIEVDAYATEETSWFWSNHGTPVTIKSPDEDLITTQQTNYIRNYYNQVENNWQRYLDLNTFLRHFLVGELSGNTDTYWSTYHYKERGNDTLYTGPVWDFDIAFENDIRTYPINQKNDYIYRSGGSYAGNMKNFVDNIVIYNDQAKARLVEIWDDARQEWFNETNITNYIDSMSQQLQQSQRLNFMRWPIMYQYVHQNPAVWGGYNNEVYNVKRFATERVGWMDNRLGYVFVPRPQNPTNLHNINYTMPYSVYSITGICISNDLNNLPNGIYIVRQGNNSKKIILNQ